MAAEIPELDRVTAPATFEGTTKNTVVYRVPEGYTGPAGTNPFGPLGKFYLSKQAYLKLGKPKLVEVEVRMLAGTRTEVRR